MFCTNPFFISTVACLNIAKQIYEEILLFRIRGFDRVFYGKFFAYFKVALCHTTQSKN